MTHDYVFKIFIDWDLGVCLAGELKRKGISHPDALKSWIDLKGLYKVTDLKYSKKNDVFVHWIVNSYDIKVVYTCIYFDLVLFISQ